MSQEEKRRKIFCEERKKKTSERTHGYEERIRWKKKIMKDKEGIPTCSQERKKKKTEWENTQKGTKIK